MKFLRELVIVLVSGIIITSVVVFAGSLTPINPPGTTFFTLSDIYEKIQDNNYATSSRVFTPSLAPAGTFVTLQNIWDKIFEISSSINSENIIAPITILGVAGTYDVSNLTPDKVAQGVVYGNGFVGTRISCPSGYHYVDDGCSNSYSYLMDTWNREYSDGETLPDGVYYPFTAQYGYPQGYGHPLAFDESGKIYAAYYRGYIYSSDEGTTWTMVDLSKKIAQGTHWPTSVAVSPDGQNIWVSIRGAGIYVSRDSGLNFELENQLTGLNLGGEIRVLLSPYHDNHLIVYTTWDTGYGQRAGQIYRSIDSGDTWQSLNAAISAAGSVGPSNGSPIAFDSDSTDIFYYISMVSSNTAGLYVTDNGGTSFSQISGTVSYASAVGRSDDGSGSRLVISGACVMAKHTSLSVISWANVGGSNSNCGYDSVITVHPLNLTDVYIWNKGGYSTDGGKNAQTPTTPSLSPDTIASSAPFADPFNNHTFFVGSTYGKLLKSTDGGASFDIVGTMPYSE